MGDVLEKTKSKCKEMNSMSEDTSVDWRGRPCNSKKHGGMTAAAFVLGLFLSVFLLCLENRVCFSFFDVF